MKRLIIISLVIVTIFTFVGCGTESNSSSKTSTTVTTTVDSIKSNKYYNDIDSAIQTIVKAYKTKSFNERAAMYPDYFIKGEYGGNAGLKEAIKGFYTCDTEYKINSIKDMTDKYAKKCIKEIKVACPEMKIVGSGLSYPGAFARTITMLMLILRK